MVMGWLSLLFVPTIYDQLGLGAILFIFLGGLCYTIGVIIFTTKRPKLWHRSFSYHELFHVLVIAGSVFHFVAILVYAIPATI
jgi:hemolysin III